MRHRHFDIIVCLQFFSSSHHFSTHWKFIQSFVSSQEATGIPHLTIFCRCRIEIRLRPDKYFCEDKWKRYSIANRSSSDPERRYKETMTINNHFVQREISVDFSMIFIFILLLLLLLHFFHDRRESISFLFHAPPLYWIIFDSAGADTFIILKPMWKKWRLSCRFYCQNYCRYIDLNCSIMINNYIGFETLDRTTRQASCWACGQLTLLDCESRGKSESVSDSRFC